jgi:hypothetical protein
MRHHRWIDTNPAVLVEVHRPRPPKPMVWTRQRVATWRDTGKKPSPVMIWTPEHTGAFLDQVHDKHDRLYALYHLIVFTGLRRGEACGLHWDDVDLDAKSITSAGRSPSTAGRPHSTHPRPRTAKAKSPSTPKPSPSCAPPAPASIASASRSARPGRRPDSCSPRWSANPCTPRTSPATSAPGDRALTAPGSVLIGVARASPCRGWLRGLAGRPGRSRRAATGRCLLRGR